MPNGVPMSWLRTSYDHPPLFVDEGKGGHFRDVDGNDYADFNIADMSMFGGYAPEPVVEAVAKRMAAGSQFLLPSEDSIWVAEELQRRFGLPKWQFTLSATHANTEAIRVARTTTGRDRVLLFDGKYHGHFDETLVELEDGQLVPGEVGLPRDVTSKTTIVQFNDVEALRRGLGDPRDRDRAHRARPHERDRAAAARSTTSTPSCARSPARPAPCSPTTRRTPRSSAPVA